MPNGRRQYYFGSYGLIRGFGPLFRTLREADESVFEDGRDQRRNGGSTDRNAVVVAPDTGLCWWADEDDIKDGDMLPVKTPNGEQARYPKEVIRNYEGLWGSPSERAGFG